MYTVVKHRKCKDHKQAEEEVYLRKQLYDVPKFSESAKQFRLIKRRCKSHAYCTELQMVIYHALVMSMAVDLTFQITCLQAYLQFPVRQ